MKIKTKIIGYRNTFGKKKNCNPINKLGFLAESVNLLNAVIIPRHEKCYYTPPREVLSSPHNECAKSSTQITSTNG